MSKELVADYIKKLVPYVPGKPIEELERELGIKDSIKIASQREPARALAQGAWPRPRPCSSNLHRYPDGSATTLQAQAGAKARRARRDDRHRQRLATKSSNWPPRPSCRPGDHAVISAHAFVVYDLAVDSRGFAKTVVPPGKNFGHDLRAMAKAVTPQTRLSVHRQPQQPDRHLHHPGRDGRAAASPCPRK